MQLILRGLLLWSTEVTGASQEWNMKWKTSAEMFKHLCPVTLCPVLPFSIWGGFEIPKKWVFCQNEVQDGLLHVTPITWWILGCYSVFILCHRLQSLGHLRASAWCNDGRKQGEALQLVCNYHDPAVPADGSSSGGAPAALLLRRDRGWDGTAAPVGHWRRHRGRKWAKPWLPDEHSTSQWWSQGGELDQQSVTVY